ncbi:MAG: FKBP-type peptidyl-prolyl cis-trans isomerase [Gammaproteobacteria bacterium]|nr:FKBP-type peptidyl-prolyl cis-trans isomerase [Gammaproteobacteria bacterium]
MLKNSNLPVLLVLLLIAACQGKDADTTPAAEVSQPETTEMSEMTEMTEMVGYLTAQRGNFASLELDQEAIAAVADGVQKGLSGTMKMEDQDPAAMQAAIGQAQARAEALQAGAEEIPAIDTEACRAIGLFMVTQTGLKELGFGADDAATIAKGFIAGASATEIDPAIEGKMPAFEAFMNDRMTAAQAVAAAEAEAAAAENIAAGKAFFATLADDADVEISESGLHYKVLDPGTGAKPSLTDSVLVHYKGTLIDGTQFDSSYDRGAPATFRLNQVVKGFGEGLTKIGAGGKIILYIPSDLGYGNSPRPGGVIKPGDSLIFECELLEVDAG